jgi:hypothetical protein
MAAVRAVGGRHFVNAPGGVGLYDAGAFSDAGLGLSFLTPYEGRFQYLLPALMQRSAQEISDDIHGTTRLVPG